MKSPGRTTYYCFFLGFLALDDSSMRLPGVSAA